MAADFFPVGAQFVTPQGGPPIVEAQDPSITVAQTNTQSAQKIAEQQNALQRQLQAAQLGSAAQLQTQSLASQLEQAKIAAQAQELPAQLKQQRFGQVFPYLQGLVANSPLGRQGGAGGFGFGGAAGGGGGGGGGGFGGSSNAFPTVPGTEEGINLGRAQIQQQTAGNVQRMNSDLAARGYGANSPLAAALQGQYEGQGLSTQAQDATTRRLGSAQLAGDWATKNNASAASLQGALASADAQKYSATTAANAGNFNSLIGALSGAFA